MTRRCCSLPGAHCLVLTFGWWPQGGEEEGGDEEGGDDAGGDEEGGDDAGGDEAATHYWLLTIGYSLYWVSLSLRCRLPLVSPLALCRVLALALLAHHCALSAYSHY